MQPSQSPPSLTNSAADWERKGRGGRRPVDEPPGEVREVDKECQVLIFFLVLEEVLRFGGEIEGFSWLQMDGCTKYESTGTRPICRDLELTGQV